MQEPHSFREAERAPRSRAAASAQTGRRAGPRVATRESDPRGRLPTGATLGAVAFAAARVGFSGQAPATHSRPDPPPRDRPDQSRGRRKLCCCCTDTPVAVARTAQFPETWGAATENCAAAAPTRRRRLPEPHSYRRPGGRDGNCAAAAPTRRSRLPEPHSFRRPGGHDGKLCCCCSDTPVAVARTAQFPETRVATETVRLLQRHAGRGCQNRTVTGDPGPETWSRRRAPEAGAGGRGDLWRQGTGTPSSAQTRACSRRATAAALWSPALSSSSASSRQAGSW